MRLINFAIASLILAGCGTSAPQPPVIPYCPVVAVTGGRPFLNCQPSDGTGSQSRVYVDKLPTYPNKFICTTDVGYKTSYNYGLELNRWIQQHCK